MKSRLAQLRSDVTVGVVMLIGAFVLITLAIMPQPNQSKDSQSQSQPTTTGV